MNIEKICGLTPLQGGMLHHTLLDKNSTAYNEQLCIRVRGQLDRDILEQSFAMQIEKHEALRAVFIYDKVKEPIQVIRKTMHAKINFIDLSQFSSCDKSTKIQNYKEQDIEKGFNLSTDQLIRMSVLREDEDIYTLIWSFHHIIMDGWSMGLLVKGLLVTYVSLKKNKEVREKEVAYPYSDYVRWLGEQGKVEASTYWERYLEGFCNKTSVPNANLKRMDEKYKTGEVSLTIDESQTSQLVEIAKSCQVTMNTLMQVIWGILLQRYNNTQDSVFGTVVSGRPSQLEGVESTVGLFINTIPVRVKCSGQEKFSTFVSEFQQSNLNSERYHYYPLVEIQANSQLKRALLDHILVFENYPIDNELNRIVDSELEIKEMQVYEQTNYNFNILIAPGQCLSILIKYNACVYEKESIIRVTNHLKELINQISKDKDVYIKDLNIISREESQMIQHEFNPISKNYVFQNTICELFEEQVQKSNDSIAVVYKQEKLTYGELNEKANKIARVLVRKGIKPDTLVGMLVERSPETVIGFLGILKSKGVYLPIDPQYPIERINYIISDSGTKILLTTKNIAKNVDFDGDIIYLDDENIYEEEKDGTNLCLPTTSSTANELAYVIYTSGTTGLPKGVLVKNQSIVNLCLWYQHTYHIDQTSRVLLIIPSGFDASIKNILTPLIMGGQLVLAAGNYFDPTNILNTIVTNKVTLINCVPSAIYPIIEVAKEEEYRSLSSLLYVLLGGEAMIMSKLTPWFMHSNCNCTLGNIYGPTECTDITVAYRVEKENMKELESVPIGKPIDHVRAYILDESRRIQPIGVAGELYLAGVCVARGYHLKPELTEEKFIKDPFVDGEYMYCTGDIAKWLTDGNIEFIGRKDHQVKIRGYRIETKEIEAKLLKIDVIKEAVVIDQIDQYGNKFLCGYLVADKELSMQEVRVNLSIELPDYMIPQYFMQLKELPLNPSGKVDRHVFPEPDGAVSTSTEYVAPRNDIEEKLVSIWKEVLGVNKIGIDDNFFELGGHSLKATILMSKIQKELGIPLPLKEIFDNPTVRRIAKYLTESNKCEYETINPAPRKEYYEVSASQKRIYVLSSMDMQGIQYNAPMAIDIEGELDVERLNNVFTELINRHESFRTSFDMVNDEPVQTIHEKVNFGVEYVEECDEKKYSEISKAFVQPFDLSKAPLIRVKLIKIQNNRYHLLMDIHHIIVDGISMNIIFNEIGRLYTNIVLGKPRIQYKDFALWQNEHFKSDGMIKQETYWLNTLGKNLPVLDMVTDYQRPTIQSFDGDRMTFTVNADIANALRKLVAGTSTTMYMVLLAAYNVLLSKYSGQEDIIVGSPIAGRPYADVQDMIGMFVNTLAMRNKPSANLTFKEFLYQVKENTLQAFNNQEYQFEELVDKLEIPRDLSRNPIFDTMFAMQNMEMNEIKVKGLQFKLCEVKNNIAKFDLMMYAVENGSQIDVSIEYCTKLYKMETIQRMSRQYLHLLNQIVQNVESKIADIELITEEEKHTILYNFNKTSMDYEDTKTIHELFEQQVMLTPNTIAVAYEDNRLTYDQLNKKANSLAWMLRDKGIKRGSIVGVMIERSVEMIVAILAVLKAGGAYLPLDPTYPKDKIEYMLTNSHTDMLLSNKRVVKTFQLDNPYINLGETSIYDGKTDNLMNSGCSDDLAYIIYTSGSTGKPKGVMVEHKGIANLKVFFSKEYGITKKDRIIQFASCSFDASVWEIFMALLSGASLYLVSKDTINDTKEFATYLNTNEITVATLPPNYLENIDVNTVNTLTKVITAGSATSTNLVDRWKDKLSYVNAYGPTETTICATSYTAKLEDQYRTIPIGKPIYNTKILILDKYLSIQPIGVVGELCVSGAGIARGYLGEEQLTKDKFVDNVYEPGNVMYRTGDLARWLPDGKIEFIGRMDGQVKIRGFRIELGEIESNLLQHKDIKAAVVTAREDKEHSKYLCAYIVAEHSIPVQKLRSYLLEKLPDYMIPQYFMFMEEFPVDPSGKINRKALPEPDKNINTGKEYVEPRNDKEERLVSIFREILTVDKISVHDSFFELGGHSLKATILISRIQKELSTDITIKEVFSNPTISKIAEYIRKATKKEYSVIEQTAQKEYYPLSSSQKRIYALNQVDREGIQYNMPVAIQMKGYLDVDRLAEAFKELVRRHESFRTSFDMVNDEPVQRIADDCDFKIEYVEVQGDENLSQISNNFIRPFDLSRAPLIRVKLVQLSIDQYYLLMDFHHIIADAMSMDVVFKEIASLYKSESLDTPRIQYKDFAVWQNKHLKSEALKEQEKYWLDILSGEIPVLNLVTDYERPVIQSFEGSQITFYAGQKIADGLRKLATKTNTTMYMILLAAYNVLLSQYSGQEDIIIGSPIAGRPYVDVQKVVGMFVNTLAMRNKPTKEQTFIEFLYKVKENALKAYENQEYQFEELVKKIDVARDLSRNPVFDTMFAMQNLDIIDIDIDDLEFNLSELEYKTAKFDFLLNAIESGEDIVFSMEYCTQLYKKETIERMTEHFLNILDQIVNDANIMLSDIELVSEKEKKKILTYFNNTTKEYPKDKTIKELFEEQVSRTPDNIAVVYEDSSLTYKELNERANRLAWTLIEKGIKSDQIVGIMVDPSLEMIVSLLGVLKAGGAYVPIDPGYPVERIRYMLDDCKADIVLTNVSNTKELKDDKECIDLTDERSYSEKFNNPITTCNARNLAYVIYTSGSTGLPKGVLIEHRSLINLCYWHNNKYGVTSKDRATKYAGFGFDASVWEIYPYIILGASLYIISNDMKLYTEELSRYYQKNGITISFLPTQLCEQFMEYEIPSLRILLTGGDKLKQWKKTNYQLINNYGPTENTVVTTYFNVEKEYNNIPIGRPVDNTRLYIVDRYNKLKPIGVPGELCISGDSLARGYLNNSELMREKFVMNPYEPNERMYRTGDLVRWLPDGNIEFIGRIDTQVKIRGFRIELGEIENRLLKYSEVKETVVIAREDDYGNKYLCGYIVSDKEIEVQKLRTYLSEKLPDYMVPQFFVQLDKLPINQSGKVDKKSLPEPAKDVSFTTEYVAPRNDVEEKLVSIWEEILGVDKIGVYDDFFELGGDSIKAIQVSARLQRYKLKIETRELMMNSTINQLSILVRKTEREIDQGVVEGEVKLTAIQKWYLNMRFTDEHHFNQSFMLYRESGFDESIVRKVFDEIVKHHDTLRMVYKREKDKIIQINQGLSGTYYDIEIDDLTGEKLDEEIVDKKCTSIQGSIDLENGPLVKLCIFKTDEGDHLLIVIHHLVIDAVSFRIILEDFQIGYEQCIQKRKITLANKTDSFQEWAIKINEYAHDARLNKESKYWEEICSLKTKSKNSNVECASNKVMDSVNQIVTLTPYETGMILREVNKAYNTKINDILLTALGLMMKEWTKDDKIVVNLEGHGREQIIDNIDITRTVGWFTSMYPVVLDMTNSSELSYLIKITKETLRKIPNEGIGYGILRYLSEGSQTLIFNADISFNYLGQFGEDTQSSVFSFSDLSTGMGQSPNHERISKVDVNCMIIKDILHINFSANKHIYDLHTLAQMAESYKGYLLNIIDHCSNKNNAESTPSDMFYNDFLLDEFENLENDMSNLI